MSAVKELVKKIVADNKVAVFSKTYCSFSIRAKNLFDNLQVDYKAIELNEHPEGDAIQNSLTELTKQSTVPNILLISNTLAVAVTFKPPILPENF
ncbi:unnamed protein product [Rhizopus stolonifer]